MATDLKRFTISITPAMEIALDRLKQERYYNDTQNKMIRDLIMLGLQTLDDDARKDTPEMTRT